MFSFLPDDLNIVFDKISSEYINEIRLRINSPIVVNIKGVNKFLCNDGITNNKSNALICFSSTIQTILQKVSNNCLYSINDQLINGYITLNNGVRIGVCGEVVYVNNQIKTIKNITSLNIRIPHLIKNCSLKCYLNLINNSQVLNTLILSPAGAGKTTFIRDFTQQLVERINGINILVVDERGEICSVSNGGENYLTNNVDVYSNCSKEFGFENGIRSMKPDVIVTDELNFSTDSKIIENAITCGCSVVASIHANNIIDLKSKPEFLNLLNKKLFKRFVVLSSNDGPGTLEGVFDENLNRVYIG